MVMKEKERIPKLVLLPSSIECRGWSLADKDNTFECYDCKSRLFYVRQQFGIVDEGPMVYQVLGYKNKDEPHIAFRQVGLALFCAECGSFNDDFYKYFYPVEKTICTWDDDELAIAEKEEIELVIDIFNRTGKIEIKDMFGSSQLNYMKKKIEEYFKNQKESKDLNTQQI